MNSDLVDKINSDLAWQDQQKAQVISLIKPFPITVSFVDVTQRRTILR
jgi:hypothetical protein